MHEVCQAQEVPVPLCHREASHVETVHSVLGWKERVLDRIKVIKNAFQSTDDGPTAAELQVLC